jgi:hypothetical protein
LYASLLPVSTCSLLYFCNTSKISLQTMKTAFGCKNETWYAWLRVRCIRHTPAARN